jgi:glycosyltransferase involved in cell wall biosynthesis
MKILFLSQQFPYPPSNGGMLRTHHFLSGITQKHAVELVCFAQSSPDEIPYPNLQIHTIPPRSFNTWDRGLSLFRKTPNYPLANESQSMARLLQQVCDASHPDICHVDTLGMASYIRQLSIPAIVDVMDCISLNYQRLAAVQSSSFRRGLYSFEALKVEQFERSVATEAAAVITCTEADAARLKEITGKTILTISNGVCVPAQRQRRPSAPPIIVFVGFLDYSANRDAITFFGNQVLPQIRRTVPDVVFEIIGKGQPVEFADMSNVVYRGYVPDLDSVYERATIVVAPLRSGSGVKNKVLEAMAHAVPLVGTAVATEGINGIPGRHYMVAQTAEEFAAGTVKLLSQPDLAQQIGAEAQIYVREQFSWPHAINKLLNLYDDVSGKRSRH